MTIKVLKFGGSSLADAEQFRKVREIIFKEPGNKYVVASAPGKRFPEDIKVTDLLYKSMKKAVSGGNFQSRLDEIKDRFQQIIEDLGIAMDIEPDIELIREHLLGTPDTSYMGSRGEYLNSKILAEYLGFEFIDPAKCVVFDNEGNFMAEETRELLSKRLEDVDAAVIAGFYGARKDGRLQTFSRGGSDITGSIVAEAVGADIYENWTDVSGLLAADPRIIDNPKGVEYITYRELRALSYMGASVLHRDAVYPVAKAGIPINIRNTNRPNDKGTMIVSDMPEWVMSDQISGVAGFKGVTIIHIEKMRVSDEAGFTAVILDVFKDKGIPFEQCQTGIDTVTVSVKSEFVEGAILKDILYDIEKKLEPDDIFVRSNMAMVAVVGENNADSCNATSELLSAINHADIEIFTINQGAGNLNLLVNVSENDYEKTIKVLYDVIAAQIDN
ncbi:MAG: aspartate kinase [Bacillota bacterium]|nr:aspartate kinase [Bacillota bacterium]